MAEKIYTAFMIVAAFLLMEVCKEVVRAVSGKLRKDDYATIKQLEACQAACSRNREQCAQAKLHDDDKRDAVMKDIQAQIAKMSSQISMLVGVFQAEGRIFSDKRPLQ